MDFHTTTAPLCARLVKLSIVNWLYNFLNRSLARSTSLPHQAGLDHVYNMHVMKMSREQSLWADSVELRNDPLELVPVYML